MPRKPQVRFHTASRQYYVHIAGKRYYLGSEKNSAEALGARLIADHLAGRQAQLQNRVVAGDQPELLFINQLVLLYTDYRRARYSVKDGRVSSQRAMDKAALDMLLQYYKHVPAAKFGPVELERLQEALADRGKLSRSTINKYIGCIRCMFRWAVRRKLVPADTYHYLTAVPGLRFGQTRAPETDPVKPVPEKDFRNTLRYLPKTVARMALLQYLTGMRPMEVCLMRPRDIDMTDTVWRYTPSDHKLKHQADSVRAIPIGGRAQKVLRRHLQRTSTDYCFSPRESEEQRLATKHLNRKTPLSCGNKPGTNCKQHPVTLPGICYNTSSYRRAIRRACIKAGVPAWSPNQLRHNLATRVRAKFGVEASQVLLGHKNLRTTEIYAERNWNAARAIAEELG